MVATLGIINVSAETDVLGMLNITPTSGKITYNGTSQTLFQIECTKVSCDYKYALSTNPSSDAEVEWENGVGKYVNASKTQPGTYYLHLSANGGHNVYKESDGYGITIYGETTISINAPAATQDDTYVVTAESGDVVLPFTVTSNPNVGTKWGDATVSAVTSTGVTYTTGISFDKTNGKLTIDADNTDLHEGTYAVTLSATSTDSIYEGTGKKTIYITKIGSDDFTINLNNVILDKGNVGYGVTASQVIKNIDSVTVGDYTIAPVDGERVITSAKVEKLVGTDYQVILDDNILLANDYDKYYRIALTITQYYDGGSYTYDVINNFKVVRKAASAEVDFKEGLVYDGTEQVLATASNVLPTGDGTHTEGASVLFKVSDKAGDPQTVYESLNEIAVAEPKRKDAGTYYVYYYINHGTNDNYEDYYGMETVTIDKAPLTVTGLDDKTIIYDGNRHEPNFVVNGFVNDEEPFDLTVFNPTEQARRYKGVGEWTVRVKLPSNVDEGQADPKNYTLVDSEGTHVDELSATLTINQATATVDKSASTSIYYKNNKGTATIKSNGLSGDFKSLWIKNSEGEWKEVDDELYTVSENGPTVIVLKEEYLQSLTDNKETFEIGKDYEFALKFSDNYTNDPIATTTLQVRKYTAPASDSSSSSSATTTTAKKVVNTSAN